ncbi:MAG: DUF1294 domain-containing protein [Myxococcota bacterium]
MPTPSPALALSLLLGHATLLAVLGLATFLAYAVDKRRAKNKARRIPERTLHQLAWWGGVIGGWAGRHGLRHKTLKRAFAAHLIGASVLHGGALVAWSVLAFVGG